MYYYVFVSLWFYFGNSDSQRRQNQSVKSWKKIFSSTIFFDLDIWQGGGEGGGEGGGGGGEKGGGEGSYGGEEGVGRERKGEGGEGSFCREREGEGGGGGQVWWQL